MGLLLRVVGHRADIQHYHSTKPVLIDTEEHCGEHPSPWQVVEWAGHTRSMPMEYGRDERRPRHCFHTLLKDFTYAPHEVMIDQ